jgi:hypothetical protein
MFLARAFIGILVCLLICGCGGNSTTNNGPMVNLTAGNWQISAVSMSGGTPLVGGASLSQTGANVSGTIHLVTQPCFSILDDMSVSGTVSGSTVNLTSVASSGQKLSVQATGTDRSLTGTYTLSGAACGSADQGTINATLVPPMTGTWHGTLTSDNGLPATQVTATLTQSGPDAHGFFSLSGPVTFSGTCLPSGPITSSQVLGVVDVLIVQPGDPSAGQVLIAGFMTDPATANAFSATYRTVLTSCADKGSGIMNKQ